MQSIIYRDFIVRASLLDDTGEYKVEVLGIPPGGLPTEGEHEKRKYDATGFRSVLNGEKMDLLEAVLERPVKREVLFALGRILGDLILPGIIRTRFLQSLDWAHPNKRLRLRLILADPRLAALPWELMYVEELGSGDSQGFLALREDVSIVRHESIDKPEPMLPRGGKYRIVAAFSSPKDQDELDTEADRIAISSAISQAQHVSISAEWVKGATRTLLELALKKGCDIFHFSGHGYFRDGRASILLEKDQGERSDPYEPDQLLQLLKAAKAKVAILGACEGATRSGTNQWSGIAPILVKHDLAAVVASQYRLLDASAAPLAEQLYGSLVQGLPIDDGVYWARTRMFQQPNGFENRDWAALVLYLRVEDGIVFPQESGALPAVALPRIAPASLQVPLIGRASDIGEIQKDFGPGKKYYCFGTIGVGKTSLTTDIFTKAVGTGQYPGYLWEQVTDDIDSLLERLAGRFPEQRVSQARSTKEKITAMQELLAAQPQVLIGLDEIPNEQVAKAVLEATGDCTVILNGQRVLNLGGKARAREVRALDVTAAEELFLSLSGLATTASQIDKKIIREICERMKWLPLGVTLAAQRCSEGESPTTVLERLKNAPETFPAEDAEVRVLFRAAYKELAQSPEAQRLLVRLASYPSREASLDALREGQPDVQFFQAKDKVVALGLATPAGRDRLAEHPLLGGIANAEAPRSLVESEATQVTAWLLNYAKTHLSDKDFDAFDREQNNLLGLLDRQENDRVFTAKLLDHLFDYLRIRGLWTQLLNRLDGILKTTQNAGLDRAVLFFQRGIVHSLRASYDDALRDFRDAELLFTAQGDTAALGRTAYWKATVMASSGDLKQAVEGFRTSIQLMGDAPELAAAHSRLGALLCCQGSVDHDAARDHLSQAVAVAEGSGDLEQLAHAHLARGRISEMAGDLPGAQKDFQLAMEAATRIGDSLQQALVQLELGYVHYHSSRFDAAKQLFNNALSAFQAIEYPTGIARGFHALGNVALANKDVQTAEEYYNKALALNKKFKQSGGVAYNEYQLGVSLQRRNSPSAEQHYSTAMEYATKTQDHALEAACLAQLTRLYLDKKDREKALEFGRRSLDLATQINDRLTRATALYNLGLAQAQEGQIEAASKSLAESHEAFAVFGGLETALLEKALADLDSTKEGVDRMLPSSERVDGIRPSSSKRIDRILDRVMTYRSPDFPGGSRGGSGGFGGFGGSGGVF